MFPSDGRVTSPGPNAGANAVFPSDGRVTPPGPNSPGRAQIPRSAFVRPGDLADLERQDGLARTVATLLSMLSAGLVLVDFVHFQYNGMLIGVLVFALAALVSGHTTLAAMFCALLISMKHLFLFVPPVCEGTT